MYYVNFFKACLLKSQDYDKVIDYTTKVGFYNITDFTQGKRWPSDILSRTTIQNQHQPFPQSISINIMIVWYCCSCIKIAFIASFFYYFVLYFVNLFVNHGHLLWLAFCYWGGLFPFFGKKIISIKKKSIQFNLLSWNSSFLFGRPWISLCNYLKKIKAKKSQINKIRYQLQFLFLFILYMKRYLVREK